MPLKKIEGMSADDSPYPLPELATGNLIRLKDELKIIDDKTGARAKWGVIVTHTERNYCGQPKIQAVLYDDENRLLMDMTGENHVPILFDICATLFLLWRLHFHIGSNCYAPDGFDLFPNCEACKGTGNNTDNTEWCNTCMGSGHVLEMRRLPKEMIPPLPYAEVEEVMQKVFIDFSAMQELFEKLQGDLLKICTPHGVPVVTEVHGAPPDVTVQVRYGKENACEVVLYSGRFSEANDKKGEAVDAAIHDLLTAPPYHIFKQTRGTAFGNSYVVGFTTADG